MRVLTNGRQGIQRVLLAGALTCLIGFSGAASAAQEAADAKKPATTSTTVMPWVADVVKMSEAGVPSGVIQTFVKNSSARSTLTSDEVIYLQTKGVNTDVIGTMIEHGVAPAPAAQVAAAPVARPPVQQPGTPVYPTPGDYQAFQAQTDYGYANPSSVSVSYVPYSDPSYYSYYPSYYPYYYYPYSYAYYPYYYYSYPYCGYNYYGHSYYNGAYCRYPYSSSAFCRPGVAPVGTGGGVRTPVTRSGGSGSVVRTGGNTPVTRGGGGGVSTASFSGGGGGGSMRVASGGFSGGGGGGGGMRGGGGRR